MQVVERPDRVYIQPEEAIGSAILDRLRSPGRGAVSRPTHPLVEGGTPLERIVDPPSTEITDRPLVGDLTAHRDPP
ncbi:MAG: hypothetical protein ABEH78_02235 [Haloferacaceae archaeon]